MAEMGQFFIVLGVVIILYAVVIVGSGAIK